MIGLDAGDPALGKLLKTLGKERGLAVIDEVMRDAKLKAIQTPDDRFAFGCALMVRGGLFEAIGRAIKIQAILHGAKEP